MALNKVERICPECRAAQALAAHYCATCGAPLERLVPVRATQWLPAVVRQQLRHPLVRGAAMGAMAVVIEVAVVLIRRALSRQVETQLIIYHPSITERTCYATADHGHCPAADVAVARQKRQ